MTNSGDEHASGSGRNPQRALLAIVATGFFLQTLDTTIVNTALPAIARSLKADPLAMQSVVVAYTLTMASVTPASGWLADRLGTRTSYLASIVLFVIGSLCCAGAQSLPQLVAARVLQGLGGSMLIPIGRLTLLRNTPAARYIAALVTVTAASRFGPLLAPALGGWLSQAASWHWIFLVNVPIGVAGVWAAHRFIPAGQRDLTRPFDFLGFALVAGSMVTLSLALDVPMPHHRGAWAVALLAAGCACALAYVRHARRRPHPLFRLELLKEPNFGVGLLGNLLARIGGSAVPFLLPLLLQLQFGFSPLVSGLFMVPVALSGMVSRKAISRLIGRHGYGGFLMVNTVVVGVAIASLAAVSPGWPLALLFAQLALFGAANSMQFTAMNSVTLKDLDVREAASGNSVFSMVQMLATALGASIGGGLLSVLSLRFDSLALGFRGAFVAVGLITLMSALVFRWLDENPRAAARPA